MKKTAATIACLISMTPFAQALNFGSIQSKKPKGGGHLCRTKSQTTRVKRVRAQKVLARVTAFWAREDRWSRRHKTATGHKLTRKVVAVDPKVIPFGSKVKFPDATCDAFDTGSAVKSRKAARLAGRTFLEKQALVVDRFFETKREAYAWLRRNPLFMVLEIEPPDPL